MKLNLLAGIGRSLLVPCALLTLIPGLAAAQSVPPAGVVFKNANVVMGYVTTSTPADVTGYPNCFTTMGSYLWLRSDNSANLEPVFDANLVGTQVKLVANQYAQGNAAYVCYANEFSTTEIRAGHVASGTNIGAGMSCVTSISNFLKGRVASGTVPGTVACNYNATTGVVTGSYVSPGLVTECGYICAVPSSSRVTRHIVKKYYKVFTGTENIGTGLNCAQGNNYFYTGCSSAGVSTASYNSATGIANKGYSDGCGRNSQSFFCVDPSRRACADTRDNDSDGLIDAADPGCWNNTSDPASYNPALDNEARATSQCQDGADNDADGAIDLADFSCASRTDNDETNPKAACQDGLDNDGDGLTDLTDPGCASRQDNNEGDGTSQCQDGIDNDGDGATDLADFSCSSRTDNDETNPKAACQDGADNDADGLADLADPGCSSRQDNNEGDGTSQCQDGVDNDGDAATDFPADFSCSSRTDNDETNPRAACQDGVDNDTDGLTDLADPGCASRQDNNEGDGTAKCQDGVDNDGDGATDFPADFSCSSRTDNDETNPRSACQDGLDNDGDGLTDLNDPGCTSGQDNNEGDGTSQCQDGIDNDTDGAIDFPADFSCSARTDKDETNPKSACQDGLDNDSDGLVDLADPGCATGQDNNEADGTSQCQDGRDNDNDGATDFPDDFSCSTRTDNDESNPKSGCQDGVDNDSDGLVDSADPGCANNQDNDEGDKTSQCQDGIDNDGDGATDFSSDFSCSSRTDNDEGNPKSGCQDGVDNDSDGLVDSSDPGCSNNQDNDEGDKTSQCQDAIDNDVDGATDFPADFSCSSKTDNDESNPKSGCQDGIDNDSDGLTDLADPGCSSGQDNNEGDGTSQCQDTVDNDGDGLIDLADPGCTSPTDTNEGDGTSACQDKVDNDGDGLTDLADPGCSNPQDGNEVDDVSRLQVIGECVYDNQDGTFTAYFGYDNSFGIETTVVTDAARNTVNSFAPTLPAGGQTSTFRIGRHKGVLAVVFNGDPLVWTVQVAQGVKSTATLSRASQLCQPIQPVAECIDSNSSGLLGTFGYINPNDFALKIPIGTKNAFNPAPTDRGQPTTFNSGTNKGVFVTPFSAPLTWTLGNRATTITASTAVCSGGCVGTSTVSIKSSLDEAALKLANFAKQAANYLDSQAKKQLSKSAAAVVSKDVVRSKKRAEGFLTEAKALSLKFPAVVKNCPNAAQICQTEDNGPTIERLRGLYQQLVKMSTRSVARGNFRVTGNTLNNKTSAIVQGAKAAQQAGLTALADLPRFSTECR